MPEFDWAGFLPKMVGIITVGGSIIVALIQYISNSNAERRLRSMAILENDIKVSSAFSELVEVANGYRSHSEPQSDIIAIIGKAIPDQVKTSILMQDPKSFGNLFSGAIVLGSTPLARQLAAAESIANLAIRYPILLEPALIGLDCTNGLSPFARNAYDRLCRHYGIERSLTNWGADWMGLGSTPSRPDGFASDDQNNEDQSERRQ